MNEEWRDIKGYEGWLQVSNLGRIRRLDRYVIYKNGRTHFYKSRIMKPRTTHNGYLRISIGGYKNQKGFFVHRLVYEAFIGSIPEGMQVNHINEIKTDNRVENLNLMTPKENSAWGTGRIRCYIKKKKPVTQISPDGTELFYFPSSIDAELQTGIPNANINKCCNGVRKTAGGYMWRYTNPQDRYCR